MTFDEVRVYGTDSSADTLCRPDGVVNPALGIVAYGDCVRLALQAQKELQEEHGILATVVDCPYLSEPPAQLREVIPSFERVLFADPCKDSQNPLSSFAVKLKRMDLLPAKWNVVAAANTYNPLGCSVTFTNKDDIVGAALGLFGDDSAGNKDAVPRHSLFDPAMRPPTSMP